jgi:hypothetical protein
MLSPQAGGWTTIVGSDCSRRPRKMRQALRSRKTRNLPKTCQIADGWVHASRLSERSPKPHGLVVGPARCPREPNRCLEEHGVEWCRDGLACENLTTSVQESRFDIFEFAFSSTVIHLVDNIKYRMSFHETSYRKSWVGAGASCQIGPSTILRVSPNRSCGILPLSLYRYTLW